MTLVVDAHLPVVVIISGQQPAANVGSLLQQKGSKVDCLFYG
jgi:hypothetical protein